MVEHLVLWERDLFLLLNSPHTPYLDSVMYLISAAIPWVVVLVPFLFLMAYKQDYKEFLLFLLFIALLVFVADGISSGVIKEIFHRYRPTHHPETAEQVKTVLGYRGGGYGFISGHATNFLAFAMFSSLIFKHRWYTLLIFTATLTVAYSRIYLGVHFVTDVVPGIICGLLIGWFLYWLYCEARRSFFDLSKEVSRLPYVKPPHRINTLATIVAMFYVGLWITAPYFFRFYS